MSIIIDTVPHHGIISYPITLIKMLIKVFHTKVVSFLITLL